MNDWTETVVRTLLVGVGALVVQTPLVLWLGHLLARRDFRGRTLVQAVLLLPLVLPPVAIGLVLLLLMRPDGPLAFLGDAFLFEPGAAVIAAVVVSFPIYLRQVQEAFAAVPPRLGQVGASLGASKWRVFLAVDLPLAKRGIAAGSVLAFARGISEFGATAVVAGASPDSTETLALRISRHLNLGQDTTALAFVGISAALGLVAVVVSEWLLRKRRAERV